MNFPGLRRNWVLVGLAVTACPGLGAGETAFDSLAFVPDPQSGWTAELPDFPAMKWSRVAFCPRQTNGFPEELKPLRVLVSPAGQIAGLAVTGDHLWVLSGATRRLYCLQANTGAVLRDFACPAEAPAGLCLDGPGFWVTDRTGRCLLHLDDHGQVVKRFPVAFEPSAVARSVQGLFVSQWEQDEFHRLDPEDGRALETQCAPDNHLTGLAASGKDLWCSRGEEIIRVDPERRLPVCGFSVAPARPAAGAVTGLAADGDTLWYANGASNQIVQIRIPAHGEWVAGAGRIRQTGFEMTYRNRSGRAVEAFSVLQHIPFLEMPGQRYLALDVQPAPRALFRDDLGNVVALLGFGGLPAGESARCRISTTMWVADRRMVVDPSLVAGAMLSPKQQVYARNFHPIAGEDSAEVRTFLEQAVGGETNAYWRVRKAHDALCRAISYREPADESVTGVLRQGYGVCRNYSAAMEAFGRWLGVPVLNAWAPRHETSFLMLPGVGPAVMEVTANDSGPDPATAWRRSRWFLGTAADEVTTGVRGYAMHSRLLLDGVSYSYHWHYWTPSSLRGIRHEGWWTVTDPRTGKTRRL